MQETNSATYRLKFEPMIPHDKSDISAYVTVEVANLSTAQNEAIRKALNEFSDKVSGIVG